MHGPPLTENLISGKFCSACFHVKQFDCSDIMDHLKDNYCAKINSDQNVILLQGGGDIKEMHV